MNRTISRRSLLRSGGLALSGMSAAGNLLAQGADYPSRPVTVITPFAAGSGPDVVLRLIGDKLSRQWKQPVVVDNKPGGAGFLAIDAAQRAPADGHTFVQLDSNHLAALPHLYKSRNFAPFRQLEPVAVLMRSHFFIAVSSDSKWKTMKDLIDDARRAQGKVSYGSWGVGTPAHLGAQHLEALTDTRMLHVPYREIARLFPDVATGAVDWALATLPSSEAIYKSGKLRYLATTAPTRIASLPQVPTVAESGGPREFDTQGFVSLLAPKGLPPGLLAQLGADIHKAIATPEIRSRFDGFAFDAPPWSPAEIRRQVDTLSVLFADLVKRGNISLD